MRYAEEVSAAQIAADEWIDRNDEQPCHEKVPDDEYAERSSMFYHLDESTKRRISTEMDELRLLATFERAEHFNDKFELPLPPEVEASYGKAAQRKLATENEVLPPQTGSDENNRIPCRQTGVIRQLGFQSMYFHTEAALVPALNKLNITPKHKVEKPGRTELPIATFEPLASHGVTIKMRKLSQIGNKLPEMLETLVIPTPTMTHWGITDIRIDDSNGKLAQHVLTKENYDKLKADTFQTYHRERIRLLDESTKWFGEREQPSDHIPKPRVYREYTINKGKGKGKGKSKGKNEPQGKGPQPPGKHPARQDHYEKGSGQAPDGPRPKTSKPTLDKPKSKRKPPIERWADYEPSMYGIPEGDQDSSDWHHDWHQDPRTHRGASNDHWGGGGGGWVDKDWSADEQPPVKKHTPTAEKGAAPTCRRCNAPLTHRESKQRSGNCNNCHHPVDQEARYKGSSKGKDDTSSRGKGGPTSHRTDNYPHQSWPNTNTKEYWENSYDTRLGGQGGQDQIYYHGTGYAAAHPDSPPTPTPLGVGKTTSDDVLL